MSVGAAAAGAGDVQRPTELQRRWRRRDACAWSRPAVTFTHATCTCSPWLCVCLQGHGVRCSAAGEAVHRPAADPEPGGRAGRVHTKGSVRGQGRSWVAAAEGPRWRRGAAWPAAHPTLGLLTVCQTSQAPLAARHMPPYCLTPPSALRRSCAAPAAAGGQRNVLCHVAALPRLDRDGHLHPGPQDRAQQVGRGAVAAARRAAARPLEGWPAERAALSGPPLPHSRICPYPHWPLAPGRISLQRWVLRPTTRRRWRRCTLSAPSLVLCWQRCRRSWQPTTWTIRQRCDVRATVRARRRPARRPLHHAASCTRRRLAGHARTASLVIRLYSPMLRLTASCVALLFDTLNAFFPGFLSCNLMTARIERAAALHARGAARGAALAGIPGRAFASPPALFSSASHLALSHLTARHSGAPSASDRLRELPPAAW